MMTDSTERLYTRILKSPYINKKDKKQIALVIPIVCDSVSEYFFEVSAKEYWDIREFPIIVPVIQPFAFFDFTPPQKITSVEFGVRNWNQGGDELLAWGIYMTTDDLLDESRKAPVATRVEYNRNLLAAVDKTLAQFAPELYAAQQARDERRIEEEFFRLPLFHRLTATTLIARWNRLATRTTAGEVVHLHAAIRAGEVPRWEIEASLWQDFGGSNLLKMYRWEYSVWDKGPLFFVDMETWAQGLNPVLKAVNGVDLTATHYQMMAKELPRYLNMVALGIACVHLGAGLLIPRHVAGQPPQGAFDLILNPDKVRSAIGR